MHLSLARSTAARPPFTGDQRRLGSALGVGLAIVCSLAPLAARAQGTAAIAAQIDSLASSRLASRATAVFGLGHRAADIPPEGRSKLLELLRKELEGAMPPDTVESDDELYAEYIASLTRLVTRFNDPRAIPLLVRQGIAITNGTVFQAAAAGDAAIGPLIATWKESEALQPAVVRTLGRMRHYADSTGRALAPNTVETIDAYLLRAYAAPEEWLRHAFVDAVAAMRDPVYLPLIERIARNDTATRDGIRYVARDAGALKPMLEARQRATAPTVLLGSLRRQLEASCVVEWISSKVICRRLRATLDTAAQTLARDARTEAAGQLRTLMTELESERRKRVNELAYALLHEGAGYLVGRL